MVRHGAAKGELQSCSPQSWHKQRGSPDAGLEFARPFGLATLIGKRLAIVPDARFGRGADSHVVVERLLSISGEDSLTIDRKYRSPWVGRLGTRILIISNEPPALSDASGALANRFVVLRTTNTFLGKEKCNLASELETELPGILNWSLVGLHRLRQRGHFRQPQSARESVMGMERCLSPVGAFLADRCTIGPDRSVECSVLYERFCDWCK